MKYIYSTSQISKLSLTLCIFSITDLVASLFLTPTPTSILLRIIPYLQLLSDEYLLFTDIILDVSIKVSDHLDASFFI